MDHWAREQIGNWVGDFAGRTAFGDVPDAAREDAPLILEAFLTRAAEIAGGPDALDEAAVRTAMVDHVSTLALAPAVHAAVPDLCGAFLASLEAEGRLADGARLGTFAVALRTAYGDAASGRPAPIKRPGSKLGRNDPCPCGSGKKYKKCCMDGLA